jgi:hypothetical protein
MEVFMTGQEGVRCKKHVFFALIAFVLILPARAAWTGAGTATAIREPRTSRHGQLGERVINGDFRTIVSNADSC